jgi:hypothetical protein
VAAPATERGERLGQRNRRALRRRIRQSSVHEISTKRAEAEARWTIMRAVRELGGIAHSSSLPKRPLTRVRTSGLLLYVT